MTIEIQDDELLKTPNGISPSPGTIIKFGPLHLRISYIGMSQAGSSCRLSLLCHPVKEKDARKTINDAILEAIR